MINLAGDIKSQIIIALSIFSLSLFIYNNSLKNSLAEEQKKKNELVANVEFQNQSIAHWKKHGDDLKLRLASAEKKARTFQIAADKREARYLKVKNHSCEDAATWAAHVAPELLREWERS